MKYILSIFLFSVSIFCIGQNSENIFITLEPMPAYPGGEDMLNKFIKNNLEYPETAQKNGIEGQVRVQFNIAPNGDVINVRIKKSLEPDCDSAVVRMVKALPKWTPVNKNKLSDEFTLPINFTLP